VRGVSTSLAARATLNANAGNFNSRIDDMSTRPPLRRSRRDRMIAGVVGGLADSFGIDTGLARIIYVRVSIFSAAFPGIVVYIILWILIPQED